MINNSNAIIKEEVLLQSNVQPSIGLTFPNSNPFMTGAFDDSQREQHNQIITGQPKKVRYHNQLGGGRLHIYYNSGQSLIKILPYRLI
jgi:hypothetical protein